jgi:hypothetical protein
MNTPYKYIDEPTDTPAKDADDKVINSDIFADRVPVDKDLVHETAMGGTVAAIEPANEPVSSEIPMFETPDQLIPMGGTVAAVSPTKNDLRTEAVPQVETPVQQTPTSWTAAALRPLNTEIHNEAIPLYGGTAVPPTPVVGTSAAVYPMNSEMVADSIPMYETPVKEISLIETAAVVAPVSDTVAYKSPVSDTIPYTAPMSAIAPTSTPLLNNVESEHFRIHWNEIQGKFVDEPRSAVQQADALVSEVIEKITQMFTSEHSSLESQWNQGMDVSTEDLRKALQHYRSFFNRLVV